MITTDKTGFEILQTIQNAVGFNRWMFDRIKPFCQGAVLELGSGIGTLSAFLAASCPELTLSDIKPEYVSLLKEKFQSIKNVKEILSVDLQANSFFEKYEPLKEKYDTLVLLNVLEHLENESEAIRNCRFLLKNGGSLIILVPAYRFLYSKLDKELGHYRRYTSAKLQKLLVKTGLHPKKTFYFNALGIAAWLYGKLFSLKNIPRSEMSLFDKLTPVGKLMDKLIFHRAGLSVICVSQKEKGPLKE